MGCASFPTSARLQIRLNRKTSLGEADDQRDDADERVQRVRRRRNKRRVAPLEIAARHAQETEIMHREKDRVGTDKRDPKMDFPRGSFNIRPVTFGYQ